MKIEKEYIKLINNSIYGRKQIVLSKAIKRILQKAS